MDHFVETLELEQALDLKDVSVDDDERMALSATILRASLLSSSASSVALIAIKQLAPIDMVLDQNGIVGFS